MVTIRNLTHAPYLMQSKTGAVTLPANGEVTADFEHDYLQAAILSRLVEVVQKKRRGKSA